MGIRQCSKEIILVDPHSENDFCKELFAVIEKVKTEKACNIVIDFSGVGDLITSNGFSRLLRLKKFLVKDCGLRLVFCNVSQEIKEVIKTVGYSEIFEIADSKSTALEIAVRPLV